MSPRPDLNQLVVLCLEALEERGSAGVDAVCEEHPEHAERLRARLAALREAGLVEAASGAESFPETLGEFRLLERLGAGGMGVVYLAEQTSLGRRVALKLIRPDQLYFEGARERFQREVEAVARLAHPGIVPVHAVGEEGGIPFFVMEHVQGASLDAVVGAVRGRPLAELDGRVLFETVQALAPGGEAGSPEDPLFTGDWTSACLWIAREVAQALEHAHRRGVLHRDVKPSNVMVTAAGRVLLLDFGLASRGDAPRVTRTGSQVGSLPYMAPEQVQGDARAIDARVDVYGLGATLYELLARRPAYGQTSTIELQASIVAASAPRLRQLEPQLSRDVEAIVSVAMDPARERRYAGTADLARDLSRALDGRPVEARPAGAWVQLARWSRRNPGAATAAVLALVIAVGGPLLFGLQQARAAREERRLGAEVEAQRARAESRLNQALRAVDVMLTQVAEVQLEHVPQFELVRLELLAAAQELFEELGSDDDAPAEVRLQRLRVGASLAKLALDLLRADVARSALHGADADLTALREGGAASPEVEGIGLDLALARGRLALLEDRASEALAEFDGALDVLRAQAAPDGHALALLLHDRAATLRTLDDVPGALDSSRESVDAVDAARARDQGSRQLALLQVESRSLLGVLLADSGDAASGFQRQREAVRIGASWLEDNPDDPAMRLKLLTVCANLTTSARLAGRASEGLEAAAAGVEHGSWYSGRFPGDLFALRSYATLELNRGLLLWEVGEAERALEALAAALAGFERLGREQPNAVDPLVRVASVLGNRGGLLQELGRLDEALGDLDRAIELHAQLRTGGMGDPEYVLQLGVALCNRALAHLAMEEHGRVLEDLRAALPHLRVAPALWSDLAGHCALAAERAIEDPDLGAAELDLLVEGFAELGVDALERAAAAGVLDLAELREGERWELLRGRERFEALTGG